MNSVEWSPHTEMLLEDIVLGTVPPNPERLHQLIVKPYRIVYEVVCNEVHVLSIRHSRMLVAGADTYWN